MNILKVWHLSQSLLILAHSTIVTVAVFAPTKSRQLLANSGDPVYDLCRSVQGGGIPLSQPMSSTSLLSQSSASQAGQQPFHPDGNIIVTADYTGQIKVFRQDCAWAFRKVDNSETSSIRLRGIHKGSNTSIRPPGLANVLNNTASSRAASTRSSSRRNSLDAHSLPTNSSQSALSKTLDPSKAAMTQANGRNASPSPIRGLIPAVRNKSHDLLKPSSQATYQKSPVEPEGLWLQEDGQSLAYYQTPPKRTSDQSRSASVSPERGRRSSVSSGQSDDESFESRSFVSAEPRRSTDNEMICKNCGARTFHAFKVQSGPHRGETKLRCSVYDISFLHELIFQMQTCF